MDEPRRATAGQRVQALGDVFVMTTTKARDPGEHSASEFDEGRAHSVAPVRTGLRPPGHLWRWELERCTTRYPRHPHLPTGPT